MGPPASLVCRNRPDQSAGRSEPGLYAPKAEPSATMQHPPVYPNPIVAAVPPVLGGGILSTGPFKTVPELKNTAILRAWMGREVLFFQKLLLTGSGLGRGGA